MSPYRVYDDYEALSRAAGALFAEIAGEAVAARGRFVAALSGGSTPNRMFELLGRSPLCESVDWPQAEIFWGDERCVPENDPRNNARAARSRLLDRVPISEDQVHPIRCSGAAHQAAADYENLIRRTFGSTPPRFDLILLGLGEDAHTASLFPRRPALLQTRRWVQEVPAEDTGQPGRVSFTPALINQAAQVIFVVSGKSKAGAVYEVNAGPRDPDRLPAQSIRPVDGQMLWLLDRAAAAKLP